MPVIATDLVLVERDGVLYKAEADEIAALAPTGPTITVSDTAPASPAVGDFWVDTN